MAAAIGAGLLALELIGNMIVDVGGGTTDIAVISLGGIVVSQSLRVGGDEMDEAIINHTKREYKLFIGNQTAGDQARDRLRLPAEGRGSGRGSGPRHAHGPSEDGDHELRRVSARDGVSPSTRSSTRSSRRWTRRRPSWPPTSWIAGSSSPRRGA